MFNSFFIIGHTIKGDIMFYEIAKKGFKYNVSKIFPNKKYFIYLKLDELYKIHNILDIDIIFEECNNTHNKISLYDNFLLCILNIRSMNNITKINGKLAIVITNNILLTINIDSSTKVDDVIFNSIDSFNNDYTIDHLLSNIVDQLILGSFEKLQYIENKTISIENELFTKEVYNNLNPLLFSIKKETLNYKKYYEYLLNLINNLELTKDYRYLNHRINKLNMLLNYTQTIVDNVIHLHDMYRSYLDFYQNRVIKVLTIATTVFLPLTLITSWYGMNLKHMPEIEYEYSYPIIIGICLLFITVSFIIFRKKKII